MSVLVLAEASASNDVAHYLSTHGVETTEVGSLSAARAAMAQRYDCGVLDLRSGELAVETIRAMRRTTPMPLVAIVPGRDVLDRIAVLDAGADDTMATPFVARELLARVLAAVRRSQLAVRHAAP